MKHIVYKPFNHTINTKEFEIIDDRDSLLKLVTNRDFIKAKKLATENPCNDGRDSSIIYATKKNGRYSFEYFYLQPFAFAPIWRKKQ